MCLYPVTIPNPNYGSTISFHEGDVVLHNALQGWTNTSTTHIQVGCGHCPECASLKQTYISQRTSLVAIDHFVFFQTLTLANRHLKYIKDSNGFTHKYFDISYFQKYIKYIRRYPSRFFGTDEFKFLAVVEYGGKKHRPHMHVLYFVPKNVVIPDYNPSRCIERNLTHELDIYTQRMFTSLLRAWRVNKSEDTFNPEWDNLCDYKQIVKHGKIYRNYDFVRVRPECSASGSSKDVVYYVTKYVHKFDRWITRKQQSLKLNLDADEYDSLWKTIKPRVLMSKHFGDDPKYRGRLISCVNFSCDVTSGEDARFLYINPVSGKAEPLAPYLRSAYVTWEDFKRLNKDRKNWLPNPEKDPQGKDLERRKQYYNKIYPLIFERNEFDYYEIE